MTQKRNFIEGIILSNNQPLAKGLRVWQSLVQLSKGKRFFERYDLFCSGYVREENCRELLKDGWYIGAISANAMQFNGKAVPLTGRHGKRAAILVNFKTKECRIITRVPTQAQAKKIEELGSKMKRIPLVVHSAEALKARIYVNAA